MRLRLRSLRVRAPLVVALAVIAMPVFAWLAHLSDATVGRRMLLRVERTAQDAADRAETPTRVDDLARTRGVWVRVLAADGQAVLDIDHDPLEGLSRWSSDIFFGPDGAPTLADADAARGPLWDRPLIQQARAEGQASRCEHTEGGALLVCEAALVDGEGRIVHVAESSRRAIRALYDVRYQLIKLTLQVLVVGLLLGLWLGWRMVRPVEILRRQVLDRTAAGSTEPVALARDDELGDLAGAFNELLASLEARNRSNEAFAADLVHELKNPLAAVKAAAEALERGPPDAARAARLARILDDASGRLDVLVSQFLDLARAEAGLVADAREQVDLHALVGGVLNAVALQHEAVAFTLTGQAATVAGVAERLETAVRNLLDNAAAFAVEGQGVEGQGVEGQGVEGQGRARVEVAVTRRGGSVVLSVQDSGPGLSEAERELVFGRFYTRRHGGTGLGLPLARAIARAHGGALVATDCGRGACFELSLPAA